MSRILVAYFSFSGNTESCAKTTAKLIGGDLFEIKNKEEYPENYAKLVERSKKELEQNCRPELRDKIDNIDKYDTVILEYPNWCGTMPMPVFSFLESYDFTGKKLLPLCTHGGSKMGHSEADIAKECPGAKLSKGLALYDDGADDAEVQVKEWIESCL